MGARYWRPYTEGGEGGYWCRHWEDFERDLEAARQLLGPEVGPWQLLYLVLDKDELDELATDVLAFPLYHEELTDVYHGLIGRARLILTDEIPF